MLKTAVFGPSFSLCAPMTAFDGVDGSRHRDLGARFRFMLRHELSLLMATSGGMTALWKYRLSPVADFVYLAALDTDARLDGWSKSVEGEPERLACPLDKGRIEMGGQHGDAAVGGALEEVDTRPPRQLGVLAGHAVPVRMWALDWVMQHVADDNRRLAVRHHADRDVAGRMAR